MELTIKKTTEETIVINDLPKYFNGYYKKIKLTEEHYISVSETMIYVMSKDSSNFSNEVIDALKLDECTEDEYNQQLQKTISKIQNL